MRFLRFVQRRIYPHSGMEIDAATPASTPLRRPAAFRSDDIPLHQLAEDHRGFRVERAGLSRFLSAGAVAR